MTNFSQEILFETKEFTTESRFIEDAYRLLPELETLVEINYSAEAIIAKELELANANLSSPFVGIGTNRTKSDQASRKAFRILELFSEDSEELLNTVTSAFLQAQKQADIAAGFSSNFTDEEVALYRENVTKSLNIMEAENKTIQDIRSRYTDTTQDAQGEIQKLIVTSPDTLDEDEVRVRKMLIMGLCCPLSISESFDDTPIGQIVSGLKGEDLDRLVYEVIVANESMLVLSPAIAAMSKIAIAMFETDYDKKAEVVAKKRLGGILEMMPGSFKLEMQKAKEMMLKELTSISEQIRAGFGIPHRITSKEVALEQYTASLENVILAFYRYMVPKRLHPVINSRKRANTERIAQLNEDTLGIETLKEFRPRQIYSPVKSSKDLIRPPALDELTDDELAKILKIELAELIGTYSTKYGDPRNMRIIDDLWLCIDFIKDADFENQNIKGINLANIEPILLQGVAAKVWSLTPKYAEIATHTKLIRRTHIRFAIDKNGDAAIVGIINVSDKSKRSS